MPKRKKRNFLKELRKGSWRLPIIVGSVVLGVMAILAIVAVVLNNKEGKQLGFNKTDDVFGELKTSIYDTTSCHLHGDSNSIIINFNKGLCSHKHTPCNDHWTQNVNIPAGKYKVSLEAWDGYAGRSQTDPNGQKNEQYYVQFQHGNSVVATSGTTSDLQDRVESARFTGVVNESLNIPNSINKLTIRSKVPYQGPPNSVKAVCMMLEPIAPPIDGQCGTIVLNKMSYNSAPPTKDLCVKGTPTAVTETHDANTRTWSWRCKGVNGGKDSEICQVHGKMSCATSPTQTDLAKYNPTAFIVKPDHNQEVFEGRSIGLIGDTNVPNVVGWRWIDTKPGTESYKGNRCVWEDSLLGPDKAVSLKKMDRVYLPVGEHHICLNVKYGTNSWITPKCTAHRVVKVKPAICASSISQNDLNTYLFTSFITKPANDIEITEGEPVDLAGAVNYDTTIGFKWIDTKPGTESYKGNKCLPEDAVGYRPEFRRDTEPTYYDDRIFILTKKSGTVVLQRNGYTEHHVCLWANGLDANRHGIPLSSGRCSDRVIIKINPKPASCGSEVSKRYKTISELSSDNLCSEGYPVFKSSMSGVKQLCSNGIKQTSCYKNGDLSGCAQSVLDACFVPRWEWECQVGDGGERADCFALRKPDCGDSYVEGDEQCDDGNTINGDGCSSVCQTEQTPEPTPEPRPAPEPGCDASIGNYIWYDTNGNGVQEDIEEGIEGVEVCASKGDDRYCEITDKHGRYEIKNLCEGEYKVKVKGVDNMTQTYDPDGKKDNKTKVELKSNNDKHTKADFGYRGKAPSTGLATNIILLIGLSTLVTIGILLVMKKKGML